MEASGSSSHGNTVDVAAVDEESEPESVNIQSVIILMNPPLVDSL